MQTGDVVSNNLARSVTRRGNRLQRTSFIRSTGSDVAAAFDRNIGPKEDWRATSCSTVSGMEQRTGKVTYIRSRPWRRFLPSCFSNSPIKLRPRVSPCHTQTAPHLLWSATTA